MHLLTVRRRRRIAAALALAVAISSGSVSAETATAPALKAAFLYHFAKFAEWPSDVLEVGAPIVFCVVQDANVAKALEEATAGRRAGGHALVVRRLDLEGAIRSCHVLYASVPDARRAARLLDTLEDTPVLSVSDFGTFAQMGGVAHLFVENGRMRFAVNLDTVNRIRLRLSSRLLDLAVIVKDSSDVSRR
jgi:hypothetical protein